LTDSYIDELRRFGGGVPPLSRLRVLPVQLVETGDGVVVKRGVTVFHVTGEGAADAVCRVLEGASDGFTADEVVESFAEPDQPAVVELIEQLRARRFLVDADGETFATAVETAEGRLDVFYWNFGAHAEVVADRVGARRISILGVNNVSRRAAAALAAAGVSDVEVVDFHLLRSIDLFDADGELLEDRWSVAEHPPLPYAEWSETVDTGASGCVVATSDFGMTPAIREWNAFCVENDWHFLPVVLQDLVGYIGPLVVPGHGACYECLRARQNSHMDHPVALRATEHAAFEGQRLHGFHPSMASVLGDIAAMELLKFYGDLPLGRMSTLIEVNLMAPSLIARKVVRVPRCSVCSTMREQASAALDTSIYRLDE
jgi:molybdopterin-synthase adenylyltransferase